MTYPHGGAGEIWRDGAPTVRNPEKSEIRAWGVEVETEQVAQAARIATLENVGALGYEFAAGGPVAAATVAAITLSGEQTIDGVTTSASRVLVKDQAAAEDNGIYVSASGAWSRAADMDAAGEVRATAVSVSGGTVNNGAIFATYSDVTTLDTDDIDFVQVADLSDTQSQITAVSARVTAVEAVASTTSTIGYPGTPAAQGANILSGSNFAFGDAATTDGTIKSVSVWSAVTGSLEVNTYSKSGDTFTEVNSQTISVVPGWQTVALDLDLASGDHVGFSTTGVVRYESGDSDSGGWYTGGGSGSFTDAAPFTTGRLQISFEVASIGGVTLDAVKTDVDALTGRVIHRQSENLVDPLSAGNQVGHYLNQNNGAVTALANHGILGAFPVTAGTAYRLDLSAAMAVWQVAVNGDVVVFFYNSATISSGALIAASEAGENDVAIDTAKRVVTFTPPSGATHVAFSVKREAGSPDVDAADFRELVAAASLTEGLASADLMSPAMSDVAHDVIVERVAPYLYVRCAYRPGNHVVYRVNSDYDAGDSGNGVVDFDGIRLIHATEPYNRTAAAWDASSVILTSGADASPPHAFNGMHLGGGHGIGSRIVVKTAHGKTNADIGSTYIDGASKSWAITAVTSVDRFTVTAANTGTATQWVITGDVTGDLTHSAGGTNTATITPDSTIFTQLWPIAQNYQYRATLDDQPIIADGVYFGDVLRVVESYGIPNAASVLDSLAAGVGSTDDPVYNDPAIQTQIEVQTAYAWDFTGVPEVVHSTVDVQDYTVSYHGGMQHVKLLAGSNDTLYVYVPRCSTGTLATGSTTGGQVASAAWDDPAAPPSRVYQVLKRGTEPRHGFMMGYSEAMAADRADLSVAFDVSSSMKMYPYAFDTGHGATAVAGTMREIVGFFGAFDPQRDQDFTAKVLLRDRGKHALYLHTTAAVAARWVGVPSRFIGQPVTVTHADGITLHSSFVSAKGIRVESAGAGELEVRFG